MKLLVIVLLLISTFVHSDQDIIINKKVIKETINKTMKSLKNSLEIALQDGDIVGAMKMCSIQAQDLTNDFNTQNTMIKRISLKYRNLKNKPTKFEAEILESFEKKLLEGVSLENLDFTQFSSSYGKKTLVYIKAIPTKGVCLNCHGKNIDKRVLKEIDFLYPQDKAKGFKMGDIRGAFSVRHTF